MDYTESVLGSKAKMAVDFLWNKVLSYHVTLLASYSHQSTEPLVTHTHTVLRSLLTDSSHCFCDVLLFCLFKISHSQRTQLICLILLASSEKSIREKIRTSNQLFWGSVVPYVDDSLTVIWRPFVSKPNKYTVKYNHTQHD